MGNQLDTFVQYPIYPSLTRLEKALLRLRMARQVPGVWLSHTHHRCRQESEGIMQVHALRVHQPATPGRLCGMWGREQDDRCGDCFP